MSQIADQPKLARVGNDTEAAPRRRHRSVSLTLVLAGSFGLLVLVAVAAVLGIHLKAGRTTLINLQGEVAELLVTGMTDSVTAHLTPVEEQSRYIANLIETGALDPKDRAAMVNVLTGALAAAPQIGSLVFIDGNYQVVGIDRSTSTPRPFSNDSSSDPRIIDAIARAKTATGATWADPIWWKEAGATYLNLRQPVRPGGEFLGIIVSVVSIQELSSYLGRMESGVGGNAFILYGRNSVLAHRLLLGPQDNLSEQNPLPKLIGFGDPVLGSLWTGEEAWELQINVSQGIQGKAIEVYDEDYIFLYAERPGYGPEPLIVGTYFLSDDVSAEFRRFAMSGFAGLFVLIVSVLTAIWLARRIVRPISRLADAAGHIGKLEFSSVGELPPSGLRELDEQSVAFNSMLRGLRWFEIYVPRSLVQRLLTQVESSSLESVEREITVLFTDIVGFTRLAEGLPATSVADFLNQHFAMVASAIEAEGGTVDKFIGDGMMAFWGAPEHLPDHAERAVRAARAIADSLHRQNEQRRVEGLAPVQMRIGLHSGPVTVGNIGSPGRINYTIVGDTVNVGQRLEQLGKQFMTEGDDVVILASEATAAGLTAANAEDVGAHAVKGRSEPIEVFRLR